MDITDALAPTSDQLDAIELVKPRTFTIDAGSGLGKRDGKTVAEIRLVGFPRVWRPSKGMLDVLAACWGTDAKQWVGHRVTLYNDPEVMFGRDKVGGIRISHLSHIDEARNVMIRASGAGRKQSWHVEPLPAHEADAPAITSKPTPDQLRALGEAFTAAGVTDGPGKAAFINETLGRQTRGWDDLTADDVTKVTEALRAVTGDADPWADTAADVAARDEAEAS